MPELPEVETVRRKLVPHLTGRTIVRARIDDTRLVRPEPPDAVAARLTGARVTGRDLPREGTEILLRRGDQALLGEVVWAAADRRGIVFNGARR